jgi:putative transposase
MKRVKPVQGQIYHIFNRGVDKRVVYSEEREYVRFIHDLYEFNDKNPAPKTQNSEVRLPTDGAREPLVELLAFCLMPNHFHLMLREVQENGVTEFMRKLGTGYTNYFNQKYSRDGALFQGKYKLVQIEKEAHFLYLPFYIHFNPLDLIEPGWRNGKISDFESAWSFLKKYRWSSFPDYLDLKNFPSVIRKSFLTEIIGGAERFEALSIDWLRNFDRDSLKEFSIE